MGFLYVISVRAVLVVVTVQHYKEIFCVLHCFMFQTCVRDSVALTACQKFKTHEFPNFDWFFDPHKLSLLNRILIIKVG